VVDRLNIVAVWIQHEGGVVPWMIWPLARSAIVAAAIGQAGRVERLDCCGAIGLKRQMVAARKLTLRRCAGCGGDEEFIYSEIILPLPSELDAKGGEGRLVKAPAYRNVSNHQLNMIDQPAAQYLLSFH
jgi:hypothetical protein